MTEFVAVPVDILILIGYIIFSTLIIMVGFELLKRQRKLRFNNTRRYHVPEWLNEFNETSYIEHINGLVKRCIWGITFFFIFINVSVLTFIGANSTLNANPSLLVPVIILLTASYIVPLFIPIYLLSEWFVFYAKWFYASWIDTVDEKYPLELVK